MKNEKVEKVLQARGAQYGKFENVSNLCVHLYELWYACLGSGQSKVTPEVQVAVFMVCNKLARIYVGNDTDKTSDSYIDIDGYLRLIDNQAGEAWYTKLTVPQKELVRELRITNLSMLRVFVKALRRINTHPRKAV